jgi:hypothetical protein
MDKINLKIRRGITADAETLAPLAVKIFNDAFAGNPLNKPEDMRAYIAEAFSLEQTRRELSDENIIFFIAEVDEKWSAMRNYRKIQKKIAFRMITRLN